MRSVWPIRQAPTEAEQLAEPLHRQLDPEAGDRLELVERAAGVAEPAPAHHGHLDPAGRHQRRQRQRGLVPHAAGGVLVDLRAGDVGEVEHVPGVEHGRGERLQLRLAHAPEEDRHAEGGHLVVGHAPLGVAGHELRDRLRRHGASVPLAVDDLVGAHAPRLAHAPGSGNSTAGAGSMRYGSGAVKVLVCCENEIVCDAVALSLSRRGTRRWPPRTRCSSRRTWPGPTRWSWTARAGAGPSPCSATGASSGGRSSPGWRPRRSWPSSPPGAAPTGPSGSTPSRSSRQRFAAALVARRRVLIVDDNEIVARFLDAGAGREGVRGALRPRRRGGHRDPRPPGDPPRPHPPRREDAPHRRAAVLPLREAATSASGASR